MTTKASISSGYKWRLGIIALACLGFSAWFFYDGAIKYPRLQHIHETYLQIQTDHPEDFATRWVDHAREQGWSTDTPSPKSDMDILAQYIFACLVLPVGLAFLWAFLRSNWRWIAADDTGLQTNSGQMAPWEAIRSINKDRWKSKGIAVVTYDDNHGKPRTITLDDWKFDPEPTAAIVAQIDEMLGNTPSAEAEAALAPAQHEAEELAS